MPKNVAPTSAAKSRLRLLVIVWPFVAIILVQATVASFSMQMVNSLRAYITGESQWSKGQHDAIYFLGRYIDTGAASFLARFHGAMAIPQGDPAARLALEANPPDTNAASAGFLRGGNHPSDVPGLIWLFQYFRWFSYMDQAIGNWRVAEAALLQLNDFADELSRSPVIATQDEMAMAHSRLDAINDLVTPLTTKFSVSLGEGTRFVQGALLIANLAIAALFILVTIFRLNLFVRHRREIEDELTWYAAHDDLTGLPNRRSFELAVEAALRDMLEPTTLMFLDLDQFKLVNDLMGATRPETYCCNSSRWRCLDIFEKAICSPAWEGTSSGSCSGAGQNKTALRSQSSSGKQFARKISSGEDKFTGSALVSAWCNSMTVYSIFLKHSARPT